MALFKSGAALPVLDTEPKFVEFTERFSQKPVLVNCDINFLNTLPNEELNTCVKLQMEVFTDPKAPQLVTDAELSHIANLRSIIAQHIKGRYVGQGIIAAQNVVFIIFYISDRMEKTARAMMNETVNNTFRHMEYSIDFDPNGDQYMEYLYPTDLYRKQIENRKILRTLRGYGDDGTAPRKLRFNLAFPNRKAALDAYNVSTEKGFAYDALNSEPAPEGMVLPRYNLVLSRELPFDIELLDLVDNYILNLCEKYEGEFRSLETDIV